MGTPSADLDHGALPLADYLKILAREIYISARWSGLSRERSRRLKKVCEKYAHFCILASNLLKVPNRRPSPRELKGLSEKPLSPWLYCAAPWKFLSRCCFIKINSLGK